MGWSRFRKAAITALLAAAIGVSLGASTDTPGGKVEVREGDLWSKATIVRKEGRKTLIRYDDNTEEWVTADRLRDVSSTSSLAAPAPAATTRPAVAAKDWLAVGSEVEYKSPSRWNPGQITDVQRGWYLVKDERGPLSHWCEPWALRIPGSTYDIDAKMEDLVRRPIMRPTPAPATPPGPRPKQIGTARQDVAVDSSAGAVEMAADGKTTVINVDLAAAGDPQPPQSGKMTPLNLATTRPSMEFRSATVRLNDRLEFARSVAACRDTPGILALGYATLGSEPVEVVRFDSNACRTLGRSTLSVKDQHIVGAANSGKVLLTVNRVFPENMRLWELQGNTYVLTAEYEVGQRGRHITGACLTDATHAVVRDSAGNCFYIDLKENRATGEIRTAAQSRMYVDPTGQILGGITTNGKAVLIRLSDFSTIAEYSGAAPKGNVAVDPTGELVAFCSADGPVRVVKVADGSVVANIQLAVPMQGELDLPGTGFLIVDHRYVYDVQTGIPVWVYNPPQPTRGFGQIQQNQPPTFISDRTITGMPSGTLMLQLANGQTLFCVTSEDMSDVVMVTLPEAKARAALKGAGKETFILTPGTAVNFDARAAGDDESGKIAEVVRNAIKAAGLVVSNKPAPFRVTLSIARGDTQQRDYVKGSMPPFGPPLPMRMRGGEQVTLAVPSTVVTVEMTYENEPVWSQKYTFEAGDSVSIKSGQTAQDAVNDAAKPQAKAMGSLTVPGYLPKGSTPGTAPALGASDVTPRGIVPAAKPEPDIGPDRGPGNRRQPGRRGPGGPRDMAT